MTALRTKEVITAEWFRRYVRDAVRESEKNNPRDIANDLLRAGFTHDEALAAVSAMLPDFVRGVCSSQGRRDRQVPRIATVTASDSAAYVAPDVFKAESEAVLHSVPAKTRKRDAAKRASVRRRNAEQLDMDALRARFLESRVYGMEHMRWGDLSIDDLTAMASLRRKLALENRSKADRIDAAVELLQARGFKTLRQLDTASLLGLGLS